MSIFSEDGRWSGLSHDDFTFDPMTSGLEQQSIFDPWGSDNQAELNTSTAQQDDYSFSSSLFTPVQPSPSATSALNWQTDNSAVSADARESNDSWFSSQMDNKEVADYVPPLRRQTQSFTEQFSQEFSRPVTPDRQTEIVQQLPVDYSFEPAAKTSGVKSWSKWYAKSKIPDINKIHIPEVDHGWSLSQFRAEYEKVRSELNRYPEFKNLTNEVLDFKGDGGVFYPEMVYESWLKRADEQVNNEIRRRKISRDTLAKEQAFAQPHELVTDDKGYFRGSAEGKAGRDDLRSSDIFSGKKHNSILENELVESVLFSDKASELRSKRQVETALSGDADNQEDTAATALKLTTEQQNYIRKSYPEGVPDNVKVEVNADGSISFSGAGDTAVTGDSVITKDGEVEHTAGERGEELNLEVDIAEQEEQGDGDGREDELKARNKRVDEIWDLRESGNISLTNSPFLFMKVNKSWNDNSKYFEIEVDDENKLKKIILKNENGDYIEESNSYGALFILNAMTYMAKRDAGEYYAGNYHLNKIKLTLDRFAYQFGTSFDQFDNEVQLRVDELKKSSKYKEISNRELYGFVFVTAVNDMMKNGCLVDLNARRMGEGKISPGKFEEYPAKLGLYHTKNLGRHIIQFRDGLRFTNLTGDAAEIMENQEKFYLFSSLNDQGRSKKMSIFYPYNDKLSLFLEENDVAKNEFSKSYDENLYKIKQDIKYNSMSNVQKEYMAFFESLYKINSNKVDVFEENYKTIFEKYEDFAKETSSSGKFARTDLVQPENMLSIVYSYLESFKGSVKNELTFYSKMAFNDSLYAEVKNDLNNALQQNNYRLSYGDILKVADKTMKRFLPKFNNEESLLEIDGAVDYKIMYVARKKSYEMNKKIQQKNIAAGVEALFQEVNASEGRKDLSRNRIIQIVAQNTTLEVPDIERLYFNNLKRVTYDYVNEVKKLREKYDQVDGLLQNKEISEHNKILAALLTLDGASDRLDIDKEYYNLKTMPELEYELIVEMSEMSQEKMEKKYPFFFDKDSSVEENVKMYQNLKECASFKKESYWKKKETASEIMEMSYGNDNFYNLDAGLQKAVLSVFSIGNDELLAEIDRIEYAAGMADKIRYKDSRVRQYIGGFIRNNAVAVGSIIVSALIPGGSAAMIAKKIAKIVGYAGSYVNVRNTYLKMKAAGATTFEIFVAIGLALSQDIGVRRATRYLSSSIKNASMRSGFNPEHAGSAGDMFEVVSGHEVKSEIKNYQLEKNRNEYGFELQLLK